TRRWLAAYAGGGGTVFYAGQSADLPRRIAAAAPADVALDPADPAVGFVHRRLRDADVYFLANTSNAPRTVRARFGNRTDVVEIWDPLAGTIAQPPSSRDSVLLAFEPYGSRIVVFRKDASTAARSTARTALATVDLRADWDVALGGAARGRSVELPHSWADDPATRFVSGTAAYRRVVQVPASFRLAGAHVYLDFGAASPVDRRDLPGGTLRGNSFAALLAPPVREAATVFVNGQRAGAVWAPPYRVDVTALLREGANEVRIDVYNTAINQLAEGGHLPDVAAVTDQYGQRFRLQDMNGLQPIPSGLLSVPRLVVER
ncbi:MAG: glycosyl hydrolase, partial [Acidobacteriota bacterium]